MMQHTAVKTVPTTFSRLNPFHAIVLKNVNLNGAGSSKETRHIELSLKGSGLSYVPGDALGIIPSND
ncbi:protein CysJ, partial [Ammoniphilus sp. 3BR4]